MKRWFSLILTVLIVTGSTALAEAKQKEKKGDLLDSAAGLLGEAWDSASEAAGNAWDDASTVASGALDSAGAAIGQAWGKASEAAADAWNKAGSFLVGKKSELSVWMSITGSDALEKLKTAFDEAAGLLGIDQKQVDEIWLRSSDYAGECGIARVTQAKLALAAISSIPEGTSPEEAVQTVLEMILNSGIADQTAAENALASLVGVATADVILDPNEPRYYMGEVVNTGKDNGYSGSEKIASSDVHYGWMLGRFFVSGYTSVFEDENGDPVFIKTLGDQIELWFELDQDIDCLNGSDALSISEDRNGFDEAFGISKTNFGRGTLITQHTDYRNAVGTPVIYTDYLSGIVASGADTTVQLFEEGNYEAALDYEISDRSLKIINTYSNYRINFKFSVRNGNCMVYPFDVLTGEELTNTAVTENGFSLDLARSRYLDINIKREVLSEGAVGLIEDVRFNRPARDGDQYTEEGIYTITVSNRYTCQQTTKQIYVGTNRILMAHIVTGLSVDEIREQLAKGAQISEDGTIIGMTEN